jgi:hypothetical protein
MSIPHRRRTSHSFGLMQSRPNLLLRRLLREHLSQAPPTREAFRATRSADAEMSDRLSGELLCLTRPAALRRPTASITESRGGGHWRRRTEDGQCGSSVDPD